MKRIKSFLLIVGLTMTSMAATAQIVSPSKFRLIPHQMRNQTLRSSLPQRTQESRLPATASRDVITSNCPAEAQALGAVCGYVPVPLHRKIGRASCRERV